MTLDVKAIQQALALQGGAISMDFIRSKDSGPQRQHGLISESFCSAPTGRAKSKARKFTVVSLFAGCGGMDLGFKGGFSFLGRSYPEQPFNLIWANELNKAACRTYRRNIGDHIRQGDIWSVIDQLPTKADVIIGGFPCQDISVNGKGAGIAGKRSGLYRAMIKAIELIKPKIFVAENVKGLLMKHHSVALHQVLTDSKALGYEVTHK